MKTFQKLAVVFFSLLIFAGCEDDPILASCDDTTSEFQNLFQAMISSGHTDKVSYDTEVHAYTFSLSADKEICKIGYQSQHEVTDTPYLMELVDSSTNNIIYSDSHVFSSTETSYVIPTSTIQLQSGISYTVRRIQTDVASNFGNIIGRLAMQDSMSFPYADGIMTISSADFYQNGGPLTNGAIPYIDLIFK